MKINAVKLQNTQKSACFVIGGSLALSRSKGPTPLFFHCEYAVSDDSKQTNDHAFDVALIGRTIYSALIPSVRLSRALGVSLKDVTEWVQLAYLKELIDQGIKLKQAAKLLGVSTRTVSNLSSRLREDFFAPEQTQELPTRILFALWAEPLSRKRIKQYLSAVDEDLVDDAIDRLHHHGDIVLEDGRTPTFALKQSAHRLVGEGIMARIDGLNSLLSHTTDAVFSRFFLPLDDSSFARALQLRVRVQDLPKLKRMYEEAIWPTLNALDEAAKQDPEAKAIGFGMTWAPLDVAKHPLDTPGSEGD